MVSTSDSSIPVRVNQCPLCRAVYHLPAISGPYAGCPDCKAVLIELPRDYVGTAKPHLEAWANLFMRIMPDPPPQSKPRILTGRGPVPQ